MINYTLLFSALLSSVFPIMLLRFAFDKDVMYLAFFFCVLFFIAAILSALLIDEPLFALLKLSVPASSIALAGLLGLAYGLATWLAVGLFVNSFLWILKKLKRDNV